MTLMPTFLSKESSALLARDLALRAEELFATPAQVAPDEVSLQNIFRLLEMYRFNAFMGYSPRGVLEVREVRRRPEVNAADGEVLRHALDAARNAVFPNDDKQDVVLRLEQLVSAVAGQATLDPAELQKAKRFFQEVATALQAA
jgi:hypothetical protein